MSEKNKPEKPAFDRSPKEFFFDAAKDDRKPSSAPETHELYKGLPFPPDMGFIFENEDDEGDDAPEYREFMEQEKLRDIARATLPQNPEISDAIEHVSNVDVLSLMTAGVIEEHFRGNQRDEDVDRMVAAVLLTGAENADDLRNWFAPETIALCDYFTDMANEENQQRRQNLLQAMPRDARRIFVASIVADLELSHRNLEEGNTVPPHRREMEALSSFLARTSTVEGLDPLLMGRAADSFNALAERLGQNTRLFRQQSGHLRVGRTPDTHQAQKRERQKKNRKPKPGHDPRR